MMTTDNHLVPPNGFGYVNAGICRGAYPVKRNFRFMSRLRLNTIISLTPEPPTSDLLWFSDMAKITVMYSPINRVCPINDQLQTVLINALNICIDVKNHPVYIHCLDGRRITSLLVLLLRRLQGWTPLCSLSEYWRYQVSCRGTPLQSTEVEKVSKELELFACELTNEVYLPDTMPKWLWGGDRTTIVSGIKIRRSIHPINVTTPTTLATTSYNANISIGGTNGNPSTTNVSSGSSSGCSSSSNSSSNNSSSGVSSNIHSSIGNIATVDKDVTTTNKVDNNNSESVVISNNNIINNNNINIMNNNIIINNNNNNSTEDDRAGGGRGGVVSEGGNNWSDVVLADTLSTHEKEEEAAAAIILNLTDDDHHHHSQHIRADANKNIQRSPST